MSQMSFSDFEYAGKRKQTRRERFLAEMEQVVPCSGLVALIEPHYSKAGGGRKPYPLETMLLVHLLQNWFSLSDPAMEEALYEITSMRQFARLALSAPIPEDTTIMNFRHHDQNTSSTTSTCDGNMQSSRARDCYLMVAHACQRNLSFQTLWNL